MGSGQDRGRASSAAVPALARWLFAVVLWLPATVPYLRHFVWHPNGLSPTGFIQYDQAYYFACAREYFDRAEWSLFYPLPFSSNPYNEAVYFQPHIALMGVLWKLTGLAPGTVYCLLGAVFGVLCMRVLLAIYERQVGFGGFPRRLAFVAVAWGGGLLFPSGVGLGLLQGETLGAAMADGFRLDPLQGWWFLNLGRNLVFATEAYYHTLALGFVWYAGERKYVHALALLFILSLSHPFTGTEWLLIAAAWIALERFYLRTDVVPAWVPWAVLALLTMHGAYYGVWIHRDEEHAVLVKQWTLDWGYEAIHFVPAYAIVATLAAWRFRRPEWLARGFQDPFTRLCVVWACVAFALANHEFAMRPVQPLHFTRGYVWLPLMFLGLPVLVRWLAVERGRLALLAGIAVLILLLVDNAAWMTRRARLEPASAGGLLLDVRQKMLLQDIESAKGAPIVLAHPDIAYLATVFTSRRTFLSHGFNTPHAPRKRDEWGRFLATCALPRELHGEDVLIVIDSKPRPLLLRKGAAVLEAEARCDFERRFGRPWSDRNGVRMWRVRGF